MKLSTRSRYGIRMLMDIAIQGQGKEVSLQEIAKRQSISFKYLEKITTILKRNGYLEGKRGPSGGHKLTVSPEEIKIGDLLDTLEGDLRLVNCWIDDKPCPRIDFCSIKFVWDELNHHIHQKLNSITLANLIKDQQQCLNKGMFNSRKFKKFNVHTRANH